MIYISHRGNTNGKNILENHPDYIQKTIEKGYDVEVDLWNIDDIWYFGHDNPTYQISDIEKYKETCWFHCKNLNALYKIPSDFRYFFHDIDKFTLTSNNYIWTYPGEELNSKSICVLPELKNYVYEDIEISYGICSDYIDKYNVK